MKFSEITLNGDDYSAEIFGISKMLGLEELIPQRYSVLLLIQLAMGYASRTLNPYKVLDEVRALEGLRSSQTKTPCKFTGRALKGLWHKHYLADGLATMATNLKNGVMRDGLPWIEDLANKVSQSGEEHYLTEDDIGQIVHDAVIGNWERRSAARQLTGEWIIYAQHEGSNYYLCIAGHRSGDDWIRRQIDDICATEYPFLNDLFGS